MGQQPEAGLMLGKTLLEYHELLISLSSLFNVSHPSKLLEKFDLHLVDNAIDIARIIHKGTFRAVN
jgi:hypothetical protein